MDNHPLRTCVGCGQRAEQAALLRIGRRSDGSPVPRQGGHHKGRSAYLHQRSECVRAMTKKKLIDRSLRTAQDRSNKEKLAILLLKRLETSEGLL